MINIFITATDTDAGKTFVACAITQALISAGQKIAVYKPISAGCQREGPLLVNGDAKLLSQFANCQQSITEINPIAFLPPIAPHIAAAKANREITLVDIIDGYNKVKNTSADITITEGAGGWRLPLSIQHNLYLSDFVKAAKQKVILVVNMKLGCLNHALLTYQAIQSDGLECIAWVANTACDQIMDNFTENIEALEKILPVPKIGQFEFFSDDKLSLHEKIKLAAQQLNITPILPV